MLKKFILPLLLISSSKVSAQTPAPAKTPDSIEKMFSEELNTVRGINTNRDEREHRLLVDSLIERLDVGDVNQRYEASLLLEKEARRADITVLIEALKKYEALPEVHIPIIRALGSTKDAAALEPLRFEFNKGNSEVQLAVIDALAKIPDDTVVNMLADILSTGDVVPVHVAAAASLGKIGGDRALYALNAVRESLQAGAEKTAVDWALRYASGEISSKRIDTDIEEGRQQIYYYKGMTYYGYRPAFRKDAPKDSWLIVCIHGSELNFEETVDLCRPVAKQYKTSLLVPFFDPINFPDFREFNIRGPRSDRRLLELVEHMGQYGQVKSKEIYLIGVGDGGDFANRFVFFYPERIARAAFTTTFFYPFDSKQYFPAGLKQTPLAPDLKADFYKVIKTDFAFILDPYQSGKKDFKLFLEGLSQFVSKSQTSSRIRIRRLNERDDSAAAIVKNATEFLFPNE
jgi:hypothetical protein